MTVSSISNLAVPFSISSGRQLSPPRSGTAHDSSIANITWTSGSRTGSRSGLTSSTTLANGSSWCVGRPRGRGVDVLHQVAERPVPVDPDPDRDSVHEQPDNRLGLRPGAGGHRHRDQQVVAAGQPGEHDRVRGQQDGEQRGPLPRGELPERLGQTGVDRGGRCSPAANVWRAGYGSSVGSGSAGGAPASSARQNRPSARVPAVLGVLDLPDGEVGVLDRRFLGIWAAARLIAS